MSVQLSILFYIKKSKANLQGYTNIYLRITLDGKRAECSINRKIHIDLWNSRSQKALGNLPENQEINREIEFTVGMLVAFMAYRQYFTDSISSLLEKLIEFRLLSLHLDRVSEITETEVEGRVNTQFSGEITKENFEGIEFQDVYFRFSDSDPWILCGVNLKISKGEFVLLSGDSGSGKTTLLKLLLGLYKPTRGKILINGEPLDDTIKDSWYQLVGAVMQDDQLLTGTIEDNISFFDSSSDMSKVYKASSFACVHDVINIMPMM